MGANEDRLNKIAATDPFDLPGLAALRTSLSSLQETLRVVGNPETWEGEAADAATQAMKDMRLAYGKVDDLLHTMENKVVQANNFRSQAIAAVEGLPDSKAPSWVHTALNAAEPFSFPGIGPVDVAQGGLGLIENFLGNKREEAAAAALEEYSAALEAPTSGMREARQELSDRVPNDFGTYSGSGGSEGGDAGGTGGSGGGYPGGPGGTGTGGKPTGTPHYVIETGGPHYVAPPPPTFCEVGPPSIPVPDGTGGGYIPGELDGPTYGGGGTGTIGNGGSGSGGIGSGGVLGGIGAAGAIAAAKVGAGGIGALGGTVGKLGTGGMLGAGGLAGRPGAAGGTGLIGNTGGGAGAGGAGAAGGRGGASGAGGRSGMSAVHSGAGGAGGKEEKRRARVGMAGPMAPKLDDDENLGPRAAGTRAGGRDTDASAELPDADAE